MYLRKITCSDPREFNSIEDIVSLTQISPLVEIAVQAHPSKMLRSMPRHKWFNMLIMESQSMPRPMNLALHVNNEWAYSLCNGTIPEILKDWFVLYHPDTLTPTIKRIQINMPQSATYNFNPYKLAKIISDFPDKEFIMQYNGRTRYCVYSLYSTKAKFSVLFDESGGNGITPTKWHTPKYRRHSVGYAGGFGPDNVVENLNKINDMSLSMETKNQNLSIWIDAEGKLKTDDKFDPKRAREYILHALDWQKQNSR